MKLEHDMTDVEDIVIDYPLYHTGVWGVVQIKVNQMLNIMNGLKKLNLFGHFMDKLYDFKKNVLFDDV